MEGSRCHPEGSPQPHWESHCSLLPPTSSGLLLLPPRRSPWQEAARKGCVPAHSQERSICTSNVMTGCPELAILTILLPFLLNDSFSNELFIIAISPTSPTQSQALGLEPQHQHAVQNNLPEQNASAGVRSKVCADCSVQGEHLAAETRFPRKGVCLFLLLCQPSSRAAVARLQVTQWASNLLSSCFESLFTFLNIFKKYLLPYQLCIIYSIS